MKRALFLVLGAISSSLILIGVVRSIPYPNYESRTITGVIQQPVVLNNEDKKEKQRQIEKERRVERQLECLAKNVYYEARGEPYEGRIAVAQVTVNRARSGKFPNDVCEVVYQKTRGPDDIVICQFSWWCMPHLKSQPISRHEYRESYKIAKNVLIHGEELPDLQHALFFHAQYVNPRWNREKVAHIGQHIFYR